MACSRGQETYSEDEVFKIFPRPSPWLNILSNSPSPTLLNQRTKGNAREEQEKSRNEGLSKPISRKWKETPRRAAQGTREEDDPVQQLQHICNCTSTPNGTLIRVIPVSG